MNVWFLVIAADLVFAQNVQTTGLINSLTCGYSSGDPLLPVTCDPNGLGSPAPACTYFASDSGNNFGCCAGISTCYVSTCIEYGSTYASGQSTNTISGSYISITNERFLCPGNGPFCTTVVLFGPGSARYSSYGCDTTRAVHTAYQTITGTTTTTTSSDTAISGAAVSATPASSTSLSTTSSLSSTSASPATSTSASPTPSAASGGLSTGAKVGLGVGIPVGVIAILSLLGLWFWRRRKGSRANASQVHNPPEPPAQSYPVAEKSDVATGADTTKPKHENENFGGTPFELSNTQPVHELASGWQDRSSYGTTYQAYRQ